MKFRLPTDGEDKVSAWMKAYNEEIANAFRALNENII